MGKGGGCLSNNSQRLPLPLGPHRRDLHPCPRRTGAAPGPHLRRLQHRVGPRPAPVPRAPCSSGWAPPPMPLVSHPVLARMALKDAAEMNMGEPPWWTTTASSSPPSSGPSSAAPLLPSLPRGFCRSISAQSGHLLRLISQKSYILTFGAQNIVVMVDLDGSEEQIHEGDVFCCRTNTIQRTKESG